MASDGVSLPSGMGGITRFKEEYGSRFNLKPSHVVFLILLVVGIRIALPFIFK